MQAKRFALGVLGLTSLCLVFSGAASGIMLVLAIGLVGVYATALGISAYLSKL